MKKSELAQHKKALLEKKHDLERSIGTKGIMTGGVDAPTGTVTSRTALRLRTRKRSVSS